MWRIGLMVDDCNDDLEHPNSPHIELLPLRVFKGEATLNVANWGALNHHCNHQKPDPFIACSPTQNFIEAPTSCSSQFHIGDCVLVVLTLITVWCCCYIVTTTTLRIIFSSCRLWSPCTELPVDSVLYDRILCKL